MPPSRAEVDSVVTGPETQFRRIGPLELFHVTFFGGQKATDSLKKAERRLAVNWAHISLCPISPGTFLRSGLILG